MSKKEHYETEREYLASKGLAKAGARGRFSADAHAALAEARKAGITFGPRPLPASEDSDSLGKSQPLGTSVPGGVSSVNQDEGYIFRSPPVATATVRRENYAYSVDEDGHLICHTNCGLCRAAVRACLCSGGPRAPKYLGTDQISYLVDSEGALL